MYFWFVSINAKYKSPVFRFYFIQTDYVAWFDLTLKTSSYCMFEPINTISNSIDAIRSTPSANHQRTEKSPAHPHGTQRIWKSSCANWISQAAQERHLLHTQSEQHRVSHVLGSRWGCQMCTGQEQQSDNYLRVSVSVQKLLERLYASVAQRQSRHNMWQVLQIFGKEADTCRTLAASQAVVAQSSQGKRGDWTASTRWKPSCTHNKHTTDPTIAANVTTIANRTTKSPSRTNKSQQSSNNISTAFYCASGRIFEFKQLNVVSIAAVFIAIHTWFKQKNDKWGECIRNFHAFFFRISFEKCWFVMFFVQYAHRLFHETNFFAYLFWRTDIVWFGTVR